MRGILERKLFDSRIRSEKVEKKELILGYFLGPISVILMNAILANYLNVYYTDVLDISGIWGGLFISAFPIAAKILDVITFVVMGKIVDRTQSKQGKARPWILIAAPILVVSMILLFIVPNKNETVTAIWIFLSYTLFYAVAYTMYSTSHALLVPLATYDEAERGKLSLVSNTPSMAAGTLIAIVFPCVVLPIIGVNRNLWVSVMVLVAALSFPMILMEYYFTRERVTESQTLHKQSENKKTSLKQQLKCCVKSRSWIILMVYFVVINLVNALFNIGAFYYCNWVLGSYNDGYTQALFYALGQAPLGIGIVLCTPICRKLGLRNALIGGFALSAAGVLICLIAPRDLILVLAGQVIRTLGLIPSFFMVSSLFGEALDDVENASGVRCDGFSSSVLNCIVTITSGIAVCIFNYGLAHLGYQAPTSECIPAQTSVVQNFIIVCVIGVQAVAYPIIIGLLLFFRNRSNTIPKNLG